MTAQPQSFHIIVEKDDTHTRIRVSGEFDVLAARWLAEEANSRSLDGGRPSVVVDLADLTFIDVAGLRQLVDTRDRLRAMGHEVGFQDPPRIVGRLGKVLGIDLDGIEPPGHTVG